MAYKLFEAFGVRFSIDGDEPLVSLAVEQAERSMVGKMKRLKENGPAHSFVFGENAEGAFFEHNGRNVSGFGVPKGTLKYFDSYLRVTVGEHSPQYVFVHAGVVAYKGKAIVLPASSYKGKSRLVTKLVELGCTYYSDEFALIDANGLVHPYARPIVNRVERDGELVRLEEDLPANIGAEGIEVGTVMFTEFDENSTEFPQDITKGEATLELVNCTLPIRRDPERCFDVFGKLLKAAVVKKGPRPDVKTFGNLLLTSIDKVGL